MQGLYPHDDRQLCQRVIYAPYRSVPGNLHFAALSSELLVTLER
jgi:hypothetical protein